MAVIDWVVIQSILRDHWVFMYGGTQFCFIKDYLMKKCGSHVSVKVCVLQHLTWGGDAPGWIVFTVSFSNHGYQTMTVLILKI